MDETSGRGIASFGAIMLMLVGAFNVLDGVVALANPDYEHSDLLVGSLSTWGWVFLVFGLLQFAVGFAVLRGSAIALWPGIVLAGVNMVAQLANFQSYPLWSVAIMVVDVMVIYAFAVRGMALGVEPVESEPALSSAPVRVREPARQG